MYKNPWTLIVFLWITYFLNYVDRQVIFSLLPALRSQIALTNVELGLIGSAFIWLYSLASPLGGRLADRYGRTRVIVASLLLWTGATLGTGLSHAAWALLFWRGAMGVTEALYFPAAVSLIGAVHGARSRSRAIALHGSAQFAGIAAGGWFGGWMTEQFGWRSSFYCLAAAGVLWAIPLALHFRGRDQGPAPTQSGGRLRDLHSRCFVALATAFFCMCAMLWMFYAWLPLHLYERYGLTLSQSGLQATVFLQAGSLAGILLGGWIGDWGARRLRLGRFGFAAGGLLLSAPFAATVLAAPSLQIAVTAAGGFGLFAGINLANNVAAAYDVVRKESYGMAAGMLTLVGGLAGGLAILFAGAWKDTFGMERLMRWGAEAAALSAVVLFLVVYRYLPAERTP